MSSLSSDSARSTTRRPPSIRLCRYSAVPFLLRRVQPDHRILHRSEPSQNRLRGETRTFFVRNRIIERLCETHLRVGIARPSFKQFVPNDDFHQVRVRETPPSPSFQSPRGRSPSCHRIDTLAYGISHGVAISSPNIGDVRELQLNRLASQEGLHFHFSS